MTHDRSHLADTFGNLIVLTNTLSSFLLNDLQNSGCEEPTGSPTEKQAMISLRRNVFAHTCHLFAEWYYETIVTPKDESKLTVNIRVFTVARETQHDAGTRYQCT